MNKGEKQLCKNCGNDDCMPISESAVRDANNYYDSIDCSATERGWVYIERNKSGAIGGGG